ncbi:MAG: M14 family metallopeptidase [Elusimicrobiota bacterium]
MRKILLALLFAAGCVWLAGPGRAAGPMDVLFDGTQGERPAEDLGALMDSSGGVVPELGAIAGVDDRYWVSIRADGPAERTRLADLGMAIESVDGGLVEGVARPEELRKIRLAGFRVEKRTPLRSFGPEDFPARDDIYHNYGETEAELKAIAAAAPDIASVFPIGKSVEGRSITAIRFHMPGIQAGDKPGILFTGTHHAREHLSTEVPLRLARWLAENRERPEVRPLLETRDIYIVPLVNPDGSEFDIGTGRYQWQRKNMRPNGNGSVGVDLNRNYGYGWGGQGSSGYSNSDTYRGPSAFSEPETQAVRDFVEAHPNVTILLTYHSFSELILYPWGHMTEPISDGKALGAYQAMAAEMAKMTGYRPMQSSGLYVASGDTCDWAWGEKKIFCFTFELTPRGRWSGGFYPGPEAVESSVRKNIAPALYLIDLADDPGRAAGAG